MLSTESLPRASAHRVQSDCKHSDCVDGNCLFRALACSHHKSNCMAYTVYRMTDPEVEENLNKLFANGDRPAISIAIAC